VTTLRALVSTLGVCIVIELLASDAKARTWRGPGDTPLIQAAVDSAQAGDDVLLASGTYSWTSQGAQFPNMIRLKSGVTLHSETGPANTILDGEGRGRLILCDQTQDVVIEGLTIRNGLATVNLPKAGPDAPLVNERFGGGVWATNPSSITLRQCVFSENHAQAQGAGGGGAWCNNARVEDCVFDHNSAVGSGSGGGGLNVDYGTVVRCSFLGNLVLGDSFSGGGGLVGLAVTVVSCAFQDNAANAFKGANGGAIQLGGLDPSMIDSCVFIQNRMLTQDSRGGGGAVYLNVGQITNCLFADNQAEGRFAGAAVGGAVHSLQGPTVASSVFIGNRAVHNSPEAWGNGGAIAFSAGGNIESCTFLANSGDTPSGTGIQVDGGGVIRNSIITSTIGRVCGGAPGPTWTCCDLWNNAEGNLICGTDGGNNFIADPLFCAVDPTTTHNIFIQAGSPCAPGHHPPGAESCGLIGAGPVGCTVSVSKASWSTVKQLYR